jgi:hypothetical protein
MTRAALLVALAPLLMLACQNPAKAEAASLVEAVDRFRRAEFAGKPALLAPLQAVPCSDREVCAAKEACVAHAEPMVQGITLKHEVDVSMASADAAALDAETRATLLSKLDDASRLLDKGHAAQPSCDEKTMQLKMKYRP